MVIAVDFDGTIVEHEYPKIGEEIPFATETLRTSTTTTSSYFGAYAKASCWTKPWNGVVSAAWSSMPSTATIQRRPHKTTTISPAN